MRSSRLSRKWALVAVFVAASVTAVVVVRKNREETPIVALQEMRASIQFAPRYVPWWARWIYSPQDLQRSNRISGVEWPDGRGTDNWLSELSQLGGLTDLESLRIPNGEITDKGLFHIRGLTNLKYLDLSGTRISDSGLLHLAGIKDLEVLNLRGTEITDAGLAHLKGLTNLKSLDVTGTRTTRVGVRELQQLLPNLAVEE